MKRSVKKLAKRYRKVMRNYGHDWREPEAKASYKRVKAFWRYRNRIGGDINE